MTLTAGLCVSPSTIPFTITVRRQADGVQEILQAFIGGPELCQVIATPQETVGDLRARVFTEATETLSKTLQLITPDGTVLLNDEALLKVRSGVQQNSVFGVVSDGLLVATGCGEA